ncbi:MAG: hypothetical protein QOH72_1591, partial [Solirubrobacteraceae bacterium]|nr:hypothetical protein [Solirubrobacteraceae bacterium]
PVGVALIGTGMWATQIAAAARRAGLRVVTCFSRDAARRQAFAEGAGCAASPSLQVALGHAFRRLGAARRVGELVADGALGRVVLAEANLSLPGALTPGKWRAHRERNPGGPLMQLGIHHVDTLASWLGEPVAASGRFAHVASEADIDDVGVVALEMACGSLAAVTGSYVSPKTFAIRLSGTSAVLDYRADFAVWPAAERLDAVTTLTLDGAPVAFEERDMLAEELAEFARCVRTGAEPETGAAEGIAALRAIRGALAGDDVWQPAPS